MRFKHLQALTESGRGKDALRFSDYIVSLGEGPHPMTDEEANVIMKLGQKLLKRGYEFHSFSQSSTGMQHENYASFDFPRPDWAKRDYDSGSMISLQANLHTQIAPHGARISFEHLNSMDIDEFHEAIDLVVTNMDKVKAMLK